MRLSLLFRHTFHILDWAKKTWRHKILSTLPIYFSFYLIVIVSSKTQWEQSRTGKFSTIHCRMNVEQAVAIDVFNALFINNLLIYSYRNVLFFAMQSSPINNRLPSPAEILQMFNTKYFWWKENWTSYFRTFEFCIMLILKAIWVENGWKAGGKKWLLQDNIYKSSKESWNSELYSTLNFGQAIPWFQRFSLSICQSNGFFGQKRKEERKSLGPG